MSKYKKGDKVVMEITGVSKYGECYEVAHTSMWNTIRTERVTEPLSTYTKPLEAKIRRQAAEITRLLAENKRLKAENGNVIWEIEQAFDRGCNAAWKLARKIFSMEIKDIEDIFIETGAWNLGTVLDNNTYPEATAKVEAWEKAKKEIKVGDVLEDVASSNVKCVVTNIYPSNIAYLVFNDGSAGMHELENMTKTGRHIDIDSFLKQIGEE